MLLPRLKPLAAPEGRSSYPPLPSNPRGRASVAALNGKDKTRLLAAEAGSARKPHAVYTKESCCRLKTRNGLGLLSKDVSDPNVLGSPSVSFHLEFHTFLYFLLVEGVAWAAATKSLKSGIISIFMIS